MSEAVKAVKIDFTKKRELIKSPRKLFIYATYKVGKTSLITGLDDYIAIDFENGSSFYEGNFININSLAEEYKISKLQVVNQLVQNHIESGKKYKYVVLDTATSMEDLAKELGTIEYKKTPMGKTFNGDILTMAHGAGYAWLRIGFEKLYTIFEKLGDRLIMYGHVKNSAISKEGKEVVARDINLTGRLKDIVCAGADAIGYMYRKDKNTNIISFKKEGETDLVTGTRCAHLDDQEIIISERDENGKITTHWDKIYID
jgi:hypothetical protein